MSTLLIKHVVNGDVFFLGVALLICAGSLGLSLWAGAKRFSLLAFVIGALFVFLSATPFPDPVWLVLSLISLLWVFASQCEVMNHPPQVGLAGQEAVESRLSSRWKRASTLVLNTAFFGGWILAAASEAAWRGVPRISGETSKQLTIIADSITAGIGEHEAVTWPNLLREQHPIEILDLSRMGATLSSALARIEHQELPPGIILIELGGNDILGTTSSEDFEAGLNALLKKVTSPEHTVLMFELPLPPTFNRFGQIQRRLARRFGVKLIPKRVLAAVLFSQDATLDSIHLTQSGHDKLAKVVWAIVSNNASE